MADIELVIKIPEEKYNYVIKQVAERIDNPLKLYIANGTPLPKGHGRLIDERQVVMALTYRDFLKDNVKCGDITKILDIATVIEADTESEVQQ